MPAHKQQLVDEEKIRELLRQKKSRMKLCLTACASCSLCAESCFLFMNKGKDPQYMPSYKVLNSLGKLYRKNGKVSRAELEKMRDLLWKNCMLCERCYCAIGVDLPKMIALGRRILRSQGIDGSYLHSLDAPEGEDK